MNFADTHPTWMWLYFGSLGSIGAILFTLTAWTWFRLHALDQGLMRSAAKWAMFGYLFLFTSATFACGIGGFPGNMLSSDPSARNLTAAIGAAAASILFSVPGWALVLISTHKMLRATRGR